MSHSHLLCKIHTMRVDFEYTTVISMGLQNSAMVTLRRLANCARAPTDSATDFGQCDL